MRRFLALLFWSAALGTPAAAQSLTKRLDRLLDQPPFDRHHWGVVVMDTTGKVLYQRNGSRLFVPASNTKLVVSATAAALLPPDGTVATSAYAAGPLADGVLDGDLILYGRGDPTMSRRCFDADTLRTAACEADPMNRLRELAGRLRSRGLRRVTGAIVGDGSYFEPTLVADTWEQADLLWWYAAPVGALAFNDNSIDLRFGPGAEPGAPGRITFSPDFGDLTVQNRTTTGASGTTGLGAGRLGPLAFFVDGTIDAAAPARTSYLALPDPNRYTASAFRRALADVGISVQGPTESTTDSLRYATARAGAPLGEVASRPFREWLIPILGASQNLFAEMLLKQIGRRQTGEGSWRAGLGVERRFLIDSVGLDSTQFSLRDGSGLSHVNVVSPLAFARLLLWIRRHPNFAVFEHALPTAGQAGTVRNRLVGTAVEGRVIAKTGTIFRVNAFSGYVTLPNGAIRIFSIQTNNHDLGGAPMVARIDSLVVEIGKRK
ncbi:MAG: D-alanyl-D-alanine carboxypeptidase/D-alanyl-D-alanine-endopeptidase [Gemmatimonadales bacterium]|nr:D-alanyl-D-alanine carboxypeptidase/D-alanyl-D-alanine-endopeptidase [Gemmatimonadales bacterium]